MSSTEVAEQLQEAVSPVKNVEQKEHDKQKSPVKRRLDEQEEECVAKKARETEE
ncbi:hypothetical protein OESDEN_12243, partial [Oesophagostomum dentatum]